MNLDWCNKLLMKCLQPRNDIVVGIKSEKFKFAFKLFHDISKYAICIILNNAHFNKK